MSHFAGSETTNRGMPKESELPADAQQKRNSTPATELSITLNFYISERGHVRRGHAWV